MKEAKKDKSFQVLPTDVQINEAVDAAKHHFNEYYSNDVV